MIIYLYLSYSYVNILSTVVDKLILGFKTTGIKLQRYGNSTLRFLLLYSLPKGEGDNFLPSPIEGEGKGGGGESSIAPPSQPSPFEGEGGIRIQKQDPECQVQS